jgi:hypothetical protein
VLPEERFDFVQFTSFHKDERAHTGWYTTW